MGIRSGNHIRWRDGVAHYRRAVPPDCRAAFGRVEVTKSLETRSEVEARRLEKALDVEFDSRLSAIRKAKDPHAVARRINDDIRRARGGAQPGVPLLSEQLTQAGLNDENHEISR